MAENAPAAAPAAEGAAAAEGGEEKKEGGLMAKANAVMSDLDDHLPPSVRTKKMIATKLGANNAGRAACLNIIAGEPLTRHQKRAMFRLGRVAEVDETAIMSMMKLHDGFGVTPMELAGMEAAARAKVEAEDRYEQYLALQEKRAAAPRHKRIRKRERRSLFGY